MGFIFLFFSVTADYLYAIRKAEAIDTAYPISVTRIADILSEVEPPLNLLGGDEMTSHFSRPDSGTARWTILDKNGAETLEFQATIASTKDGNSLVALSVMPPGSGPWQSSANAWMSDKPSMVRLYQSAMQEAIQSKVEDRPFSMHPVIIAQTEAMVASLPALPGKLIGIKAESERADREQRQAAEDNMAKAYAADGKDPWR
jgi:hypothetical protein